MQASNDSVTILIGDDGIGFDPQAEYPGHVGLHTMRERAEKLGGTLQVDSTPGQGTRVRATFLPSVDR
jgi:signal transduction histidine kinase